MYTELSGSDPITIDTPLGGKVPFGILQCLTGATLHLASRQAILKPGDIALLRPNGPFTLAPTTGPLNARYFTVPLTADASFGPNELIHAMLASTETAHIVFRRIDHALTNGYCAQLARLIRTTPQDDLLAYQEGTVAHLLLTELSRSDLNAMMIIESDFPETDLRHTPKDRQAGSILNYIMQHIDRVTLNAAAAHFGYEANYFSRLCHQLFQKPFSEEVRFIRMNQGKKMLTLSDQSINDIAAALGYKNPASFDRHFKHYTGLTPSQYRAAKASEPGADGGEA
ncbi:helix-turn-helix domain-containing protein [Lacticaseibacillus parakribbianus]|uniref:helix-turn-helix domain-containing protein n=1 Tax=Lacticaseibacillus parakribbianus TaxID=2970927 RepID=UPI0021CAF0D0|nr:AraC family transcriptional regulator [Lacticaseibacillus parakribbianus]